MQSPWGDLDRLAEDAVCIVVSVGFGGNICKTGSGVNAFENKVFLLKETPCRFGGSVFSGLTLKYGFRLNRSNLISEDL